MRKLKQFVYALFTQEQEKAPTIARKCLIFNVDNIGNLPMLSSGYILKQRLTWYKMLPNIQKLNIGEQ